MTTPTASGDRAERGAAVYDERQVWERSNEWHARVVHVLMRAADRADRSLARRPRLEPFGRQGIVVVDKPSGA